MSFSSFSLITATFEDVKQFCFNCETNKRQVQLDLQSRIVQQLLQKVFPGLAPYAEQHLDQVVLVLEGHFHAHLPVPLLQHT